LRYFAHAVDPVSGGSNLDDVTAAAGVIPAPDELVPVSTAQADPNERDVTRDNEVVGIRGQRAPISFSSDPRMTFEARAYTKLTRMLLRRAMGGAIATTGADPAAVQSTVQMAGYGGLLPAIVGTLVREGQVDRMTGLVPAEVEFNFPVDEEGTVSATLWGLYHDVDDVAAVPGLPNLSGAPDYQTAYMLRDIVALMGDGAGVEIDCLSGFGFTINNNLVDEPRSRFCANKNIAEFTVDGDLHRLWYPERHQLGSQTITGRLDFGDVRPDRELRRILKHTEKLVVELYGDPLGTVPPADEACRLIFHKQAPTGGGADPLQREGDQFSSYEFTAYIDDATGRDLEAVFIGEEALT
jgi:hypothetical protein